MIRDKCELLLALKKIFHFPLTSFLGKLILVLGGQTMNTQHSPFPWKISEFSPEHILDANGVVIAEAMSPSGVPSATLYNNMRLMADAPALLDILRGVRAMNRCFDHSGNRLWCDMRDRVEAAIAKAEGR